MTIGWFSADAILSAATTMLGIIIAGYLAGWQVRQSFENERKLRLSDRRRLLRDEMLFCRSAMSELTDLARTLAVIYEHPDSGSDDAAATLSIVLPFFIGKRMDDYQAAIARSEQMGFLSQFNSLEQMRLNFSHKINEQDTASLARILRDYVRGMDALLKAFDETFPPE